MLFTQWREDKLVCCCTKDNKCSKERGCEEIEAFIEDKYDGLRECMKARAYRRNRHGAITQINTK